MTHATVSLRVHRLTPLAAAAQAATRNTLIPTTLLHHLQNDSSRIRFEYMVKTELPHLAAQILASTDVDARANAMGLAIEDNMFPINEMHFSPSELDENPQSWYQTILDIAPWYAYGYSIDDLHEFNNIAEQGYIIAALFIPPEYLDMGIRQSWMDDVKHNLTPQTANRLWQAPWTLPELFYGLEHTPHKPLTHIVDHIVNWSDNPFFQCFDSVYDFHTGSTFWTAPQLHRMQAHWNQASKILDLAQAAAVTLAEQAELLVADALSILHKAVAQRTNNDPEPAPPAPAHPPA